MASNIPLEITVTTNTSMRDHLVDGVWEKFQNERCGYSDEKFDTFFNQEWDDYSDKLKKLGLSGQQPEYKADIKIIIRAMFGKPKGNNVSHSTRRIIEGGARGNEYRQRKTMGDDY